MPIIESATQRVKSNEIARKRRSYQLKSYRTAIKKFIKSLDTDDKELIQNEFRNASSAIDRANSKKLIKKNKASRTKARLQSKIK